MSRVFGSVFDMWRLDFTTAKTFRHATYYLMGFNALKNNRDGISTDDVVIG